MNLLNKQIAITEPRKTEKQPTYLTVTNQALINMSEKDLQTRVIEPLLREMGFSNVRDNSGGVREVGTDLVAIKEEFGRPKLYSIQIKKLKFDAKSHGTKSFNAAITQFRQTVEEEVLDPLTRIKRTPDRTLFITPYPISKEAFESGLRGISHLNGEWTIIDGPDLVDLVCRYVPLAIPGIGRELQYKIQLSKKVDRISESAAFGLKEELSLDCIYVDIEVLPGIASNPIGIGDPRIVPLTESQIKQLELFCVQLPNTQKYFSEHPRRSMSPIELKWAELARVGKKGRSIEPVQVAFPLIDNEFRKLVHKHTINVREAIGTNTDKQLLNDELLKIINLSADFMTISNTLSAYWPQLQQPGYVPSSPNAIPIPASIITSINKPIFLTGEAGSGKTTLLRRVAQNISRSDSETIPILIPLISINRATPEELIRHCIKELESLDYPTSNADFILRMEQGKYRLLLDGLDETGSLYKSCFACIKEFAQRFPKSNMVVTCRNTIPLDYWPEALYVSLQPFSDSQMDQFIGSWFRAQPSAYTKLQEWLAKNPDTKKASRTPVMTALLCSLFDADVDLPNTTVDLYEGRFNLLLGKWEKVKNIEPLPATKRDKLNHFLITIAMYMHEKQKKYIKMKDVMLYYQNRYSNDKVVTMPYLMDVQDAGYSMIIECIQRGLLTREPNGLISFGHLTYQEYLAAKYLSRENPISYILQVLEVPWWRNSLSFYATIQKDITRLLETYLKENAEIKPSTLLKFQELIDLAPLTDIKVTNIFESLNQIIRSRDFRDNKPIMVPRST